MGGFEDEENRPTTAFPNSQADVFFEEETVSTATSQPASSYEQLAKLLMNFFESQPGKTSFPPANEMPRRRCTSNSTSFVPPLRSPFQQRNWTQTPEVHLSSKGKPLRIHENCKFR